jgi:hypothetical protein
VPYDSSNPLATVRYVPHPVQQQFHEDPRQSRWFCAGYGTGKTTVGVMEAFGFATVQHPGYVGIVAAPTFPLLMQAFFAEWIQWIPRDWWTLHRDPKRGDEIRLRTPEGKTSTLILRSTSNPWSNEGINAAWMVYDEAVREANPSAYNVLMGRIRRGYPGRQRGVILTGPPPDEAKHWTLGEFGQGPADGGRDGTYNHWYTRTHAVVRARTRDNPYLPADYETRLRSRPGASKAWCKRFLDAEFGAALGQIYSMFSREIHVVPAASLVGRKWRRVGVGVDWGWTHPGAMVVGSEDGQGNIFITSEEVHQYKVISEAPEGWVSIGKKVAKATRADSWFCDPSQPQAMDALEKGLRKVRASQVFPADNDVAEGIRRVSAHLEWSAEEAKRVRRSPGSLDGYAALDINPWATSQRHPGLYVSDACPKLIECLETYGRKKNKLGEFTEAPVKIGDDPADALRYLIMGMTNP